MRAASYKLTLEGSQAPLGNLGSASNFRLCGKGLVVCLNRGFRPGAGEHLAVRRVRGRGGARRGAGVCNP